MSPTASGKSLITYLLVRFNLLRLKESNKKILIIVPTTSLVEQLFKDFKDYGWCLKETYIEYIKATQKKQTSLLLYLLGNLFTINLKMVSTIWYDYW